MTESETASLVVGVASIAVAVLATWVAVVTMRIQQRQERRTYAKQIDDFVEWFLDRDLTTEKGVRHPGSPKWTYIPAAMLLRRNGDRMGQPNTRALCDWAMDYLHRRSQLDDRERSWDEANVVANVASIWVRQPGELRAAISEADPMYQPTSGAAR